MADHHRVQELLAKLDILQKKQHIFLREINELKEEILALGTETSEVPKHQSDSILPKPDIVENTNQVQFAVEEKAEPATAIPKKKSDLEKFIGENLINKVGIIITILGVAIGAKYSIENDLISPLTRIILGYLCGVILLGVGLKLKKNYENYSSVLVSGAIAIMYFITYAAFSFYALFPQAIAFALMLLFTALTIFAALRYDRTVIAHIGMVGAYAIPFLLSSGEGKAEILFTYMAIINIGILILSFKKYWKSLFYASFGFTWLIMLAWLINDYNTSKDFTLALIFSLLLFITFYITFLGYRLLQKEKFNAGDVLLVLSNSFIFYAIGFYIFNETASREEFAGLFTIGNALLHAIVCLIIYRRKTFDKNLFYLITGLVLCFITIAVPVQLDASWVTLLWSFEAALLFWIGRTRNTNFYEKISYPLMALAFISVMEDWANFYSGYPQVTSEILITPFLNIGFLTSVLFLAAFAFIVWINRRTRNTIFMQSVNGLQNLVSYAVSGIFLFSLYYAFRLEIELYWQQLYLASAVDFTPADGMGTVQYYNFDLLSFQSVWVINYSLLYLSFLSYINIKKLKNSDLGIILLGLNVLALLVFLTQGLISLGDLRQSHLHQGMAEYYTTNNFYIWIRYISIALASITLAVTYRLVRKDFMKTNFAVSYDIFLHFTILSIASAELFSWIEIYNPGNSYKLGLSILWGVYSLLLILLGIKQNKKHLRVVAISVFGITLVKLFLYDISDLDTISKTIVFVCLGILLLIISFLYNKFKHKISV